MLPPGAAFGITNQSEFNSRAVGAYEYTFMDSYDGTFFKDDIGLVAFQDEIPNVPAVQLSPFPASQLSGTQLYTAGWCVLTLAPTLVVMRGRAAALRHVCFLAHRAKSRPDA